MEVRRVVTGRAADGTSRVVLDAPAPRTHDFLHVPGMSSTLIWASEPSAAIAADGADPTLEVGSFLPPPGGTRFIVMRFAPDAVFAAPDFDGPAADAEQHVGSPGLAELFEPDAPGMHTTDTFDYAIVLEGEVWLELDGGDLTHLRAGDVVVQNGTRHAWRNLGATPVTMAFVLVGGRR
jgi:mannose-6-phosphate isomerase-like protein (cupin superfamily)